MFFSKKNKTSSTTSITPNINTVVVGQTDTKCLPNKKEAAEVVVSRMLEAQGGIYKVYNNLYLWNEDNSKIYQIDHLAIGWKNIYVIETKDVTGCPYIGTLKEEYWGIGLFGDRSMFYIGNERFGKYIKNPTIQNQKHVDFIKTICPYIPEDKLLNLVVFQADDKGYSPSYGSDKYEEGKKYPRTILTNEIFSLLNNDDKIGDPLPIETINNLIDFFDNFLHPSKEIVEKHLERAKIAKATV